MSAFKEGVWRIETVLVNKKTVMNNEGFVQFEVADGELVIQPMGMKFRIQPETMFSAALVSAGQIYYADWTVDEDQIELNLSRPEFKDLITIHATLATKREPSFA